MQLNLQSIKSSLELKVIRSLIAIIFKFINSAREMQQMIAAESQDKTAVQPSLLEAQTSEMRHGCVSKALQLIDAICKYNIEQETLRGESVEAI